jgi:hypothetical protein
MKLAIPLSLLVVTIALAACEDQVGKEAVLHAQPGFDEVGSFDASTDWAESILESADADFAGRRDPASRSQTRVGPQPWPQDLPGRWPVLREATVVADVKQSAGDRLLLVNVPGSPDRAMATYQSALRERGYDVEQPRLRYDRRALHAQSGEHEVVLTFFAREKVTRIEILFLERATG